MIAAERVGAFLDGEAAIVAQDVGVSACSVLPVDDDVRLDIVSHRFITAERVKGPWVLCHIGGRWGHLVRWLMTNSEPTVIVRHIFIAIVSTLSEALLKSITLVHQDRLKVARTVHTTVIQKLV